MEGNFGSIKVLILQISMCHFIGWGWYFHLGRIKAMSKPKHFGLSFNCCACKYLMPFKEALKQTQDLSITKCQKHNFPLSVEEIFISKCADLEPNDRYEGEKANVETKPLVFCESVTNDNVPAYRAQIRDAIKSKVKKSVYIPGDYQLSEPLKKALNLIGN